MQIAVLGVIVWTEMRSRARENLAASRAKQISGRRHALTQIIDKGLELQRNVPVGGTVTTALEAERQREWQKLALAWMDGTQAFLEKHAPAAATAFMIVSGPGADRFMVMSSSGQLAEIQDSVRYFYQRLSAHLSNLRGIVQLADSYF